MRVAAMWLIHVNFVIETALWTLVSLGGDRTARRHPGRLVREVWSLRRSPFISARALRRLARYHHLGFHPNEWDDSELIAMWRAELFGANGTLINQKRD